MRIGKGTDEGTWIINAETPFEEGTLVEIYNQHELKPAAFTLVELHPGQGEEWKRGLHIRLVRLEDLVPKKDKPAKKNKNSTKEKATNG